MTLDIDKLRALAARLALNADETWVQAPNDLGAQIVSALDEIERLRAEVAGLRSTETELTRMLGSVETDYEACCVDRDAIRARLAELSNIVDRQRDDLLQRDETLALIERNEPVRAFFALAQVMREVRAANARLAEVERERDELRRAYQAEHGGLLRDAIDQVVEATRWEAAASTAGRDYEACCAERDTLRARLAEVESDTAERIAAWLESRRKHHDDRRRRIELRIETGDVDEHGWASSYADSWAADIRAGAWRKGRS